MYQEMLTEKVSEQPQVTQQASVTFDFDYYTTSFLSSSFCPIPGRRRTPTIVCTSALPMLWSSIFRRTTQVGREEPCSPSTGLSSFTEADWKLHLWRMNLREINYFSLKISLKICEVCWLQAKTVWIFFSQIPWISALRTKMTASKRK